MEMLLVLYVLGVFGAGLIIPVFYIGKEIAIDVAKTVAYVFFWPLVAAYLVTIGSIAIVKDFFIK